MNTVELRQQRAKLINDARALLEVAEKEDRAMTQEEKNSWDAMMAQVDELADDIQRQERMEVLEKELETSAGRRVPADVPSQVYSRARQTDTDEYRKAFIGWMRDGYVTPELRALQADSDIYGGYLVAPQQMVNELIKAVDNMVYIRQWATTYRVANADSLGAVSLDNDPADAAWTTELATGSEDSTMSFGKRALHPHPLAKRIKVSNTLLRKVPSVESLVNERLAYKFAVTLESAYMTGTGAQQPLGLFTASNDGISTSRDVSTGNSDTAIGADNLRECKYTLKMQYRPRARWLFHRDAVKGISKLKDGDGQYLWQPGLRAGDPDTLLNIPVFESEYAPNTFTSGLYVGLVGDFSFYWIADSLGMTMQRLVELYAETNQVGMIGRMETDGMPVLQEAFVRVKLA